MTIAASPLLGITSIEAQQDLANVRANEAFAQLEAFAFLTSIKDRDLATPPGSPANGDRYLIAASPTGVWTGQAGKLTVYINGAWKFYTAREGLRSWIEDENKEIRYDGSAWQEVALVKVLTRSLSILNPTTSENSTLGYFTNASTIRRIIVVTRGTTPSRTWTLRKASDRSAAGTEVVTGGTVTTNTTTGAIITSFNSASIPAANFLWFTTTAGSGTVTELSITIEYTED